MSSKEKAHSQDKSTAKQRPPQHEGQAPETADWLNQPATIVRRAALAPGSLTPEDVLRLQRTVGNRALLRLSGVGGPSPEAGPLGQRRPGAGSQRTVQRQEEDEEPLQMQPLQRQELDEEEVLQAKTDTQRVGVEGGSVPPEVESAINSARGGGRPLERAVQDGMSATMGHDFSGVRVHTDAEADELNQQLQAKAFTTGPDVFFKAGAYDPSSGGGRELIAHELTHVVQQGMGKVSGEGRGMTVRPADDGFEQEAQAIAQQADSAERVAPHHALGRAGARTQHRRSPATTSRQGTDLPVMRDQNNRGETQYMVVQRAGEEEDARRILGRLAPAQYDDVASEMRSVYKAQPPVTDPNEDDFGKLLELLYVLHTNAAYLQRELTGKSADLKDEVNRQLRSRYDPYEEGNIFRGAELEDAEIAGIMRQGVERLRQAWASIEDKNLLWKKEYISQVFSIHQGYSKVCDSIPTQVHTIDKVLRTKEAAKELERFEKMGIISEEEYWEEAKALYNQ